MCEERVFEKGKKYVFSHRKYKKDCWEKCCYVEKLKGIVFISEGKGEFQHIGDFSVHVDWCTKLN